MLTKKQLKLLKRKIEVFEPIIVPYELYSIVSYYNFHLKEIYKSKSECEYDRRRKYYIKIAIKLGFYNEKLNPTRLLFRYKYYNMIGIR